MNDRSLVRALHARVPDAPRVDGYYAPIALAWGVRLARSPRRQLVVGVQGPQGSGKSTLAAAVVAAFVDVGTRAVTVSIDDFYLTYDEQQALAARYPDNPYLRYRGYPGTHDVGLGTRTIDALALLGPDEETLVSHYDKSAHDGRGDRAPRSAWKRVVGPVELLVVEGWMLGMQPLESAPADPSLAASDALLGPYRAWTAKLDSFLRLDVASLDTIVDWRVDAERARRKAGEPALSDDDARDFIERFLPAYRAYLPGLRARPPCPDEISVLLGADRAPRVWSLPPIPEGSPED